MKKWLHKKKWKEEEGIGFHVTALTFWKIKRVDNLYLRLSSSCTTIIENYIIEKKEKENIFSIAMIFVTR